MLKTTTVRLVSVCAANACSRVGIRIAGGPRRVRADSDISRFDQTWTRPSRRRPVPHGQVTWRLHGNLAPPPTCSCPRGETLHDSPAPGFPSDGQITFMSPVECGLRGNHSREHGSGHGRERICTVQGATVRVGPHVQFVAVGIMLRRWGGKSRRRPASGTPKPRRSARTRGTGGLDPADHLQVGAVRHRRFRAYRMRQHGDPPQ